MPRRARLAIAGIPWHIIQRGNNRSAVFFAPDDYVYYLRQLKTQSTRFGCAIHAYCLMTNHIHLLLTPETVESASLVMKNLGQRYTQYVNRTYQRSGTLWEGRFKSCLAQDERYALTCYRYIELNPVRAGIVSDPGDYAWSSYACNGEGIDANLISPHSSYLSLGPSKTQRLTCYRTLLKQQLDEPLLHMVRNATNGNYVLGEKPFQLDIQKTLRRRVSRGCPGRPHRKSD